MANQWPTSHSHHHMAYPRLTLAPPPTCLPYLPTRRTGFDSRVRGSGRLDWRLWGWLPAHSANGPALDRTLLVRWLAGELMTVCMGWHVATAANPVGAD